MRVDESGMRPDIKNTVRFRMMCCLRAIAVIGGMMMAAGNAQCADYVAPPEAQSLIGMKFQSEKLGRFGNIEGWEAKRGTVLNALPDSKRVMSVEELYRDGVTVFVTELLDQTDWSKTILDVQMLPRQLLNYNINNGQIVWKKNLFQFYQFEICEREHYELIVGLVRPEHGKANCTHKSKQIKRAWKINEQSGLIAEISPQGVLCHWDTEDSCE